MVTRQRPHRRGAKGAHRQQIGKGLAVGAPPRGRIRHALHVSVSSQRGAERRTLRIKSTMCTYAALPLRTRKPARVAALRAGAGVRLSERISSRSDSSPTILSITRPAAVPAAAAARRSPPLFQQAL